MSPIHNPTGLASVMADMANTFTNATALATASPDENIVIWQSALWAVLALALNAMTQPSSADPSPTPTISLVRSSPLICLMDIVSIPVWLVVGCYYGESASNSLAAKRMATCPNCTPASVPIFSATTSAVFFILGPLPQAIKLAGMSNVPFTRSTGLIFLVAYLLGVYEADAVHRASRRHQEEPSLSFAVKAQRIPETVRTRLASFAKESRIRVYGSHCGLWLTVAHMVVYPNTGADKVGQEKFLASMILLPYMYPFFLVALPAGVFGEYYFGSWLHERYSGSVGLKRMRPVAHACLQYGPAALSAFSAYTLAIFLFQLLRNYFMPEQGVHLGWKSYADTKESLAKFSGLLLVLFVLAICIPLLATGLSLAIMKLKLIIAPVPEINNPTPNEEADDDEFSATLFYNVAMLGFALSNLLFGILYYAHAYAAEGTSKPGWSEMLG